MGTFITQTATPDLYITKVPAPGASIPPGLTAANVVQAADMNALEGALMDVRTELRSGAFNVKHFGALGDGLADDTAAFAAAIAAASALPLTGRPAIVVPPGNYLLSGLSIAARDIAILGGGVGNTTLTYTGTTGALFNLGTFQANPVPVYVNTAQGFRLEGLRLLHPPFVGYGPGKDGVRTATAVQDNGSGDVVLLDVYVSGFKYGLFAPYGSDFDAVTQCHFFGNDTPIYLGRGSDQFRGERIQFTAGMEGLVVEGSAQGSLADCYFVDNATSDVAFVANNTTRSGIPAGGSPSYELRWSLLDCWHESGAGYGANRGPASHILLEGNASALNPRHVSIQRPYLVSGGTFAPGTYFVNVQSGRNVRLTDCTVNGSRIEAVFNMKPAHFAPMHQENTRIVDGFTVPLWANPQTGMRYFDPFTNTHLAYAQAQAWLDLNDASVADKRVRLRNNSDDSFSIMLWDGVSAFLERVKFHLGGARLELNTRTLDWGTAPPATGTWTQGSVRFNSAATVGQPKGWRCTVAGTPGTWVSEGNL